MSPPFVIFALPRSRTAWLSKFLSHGGWHCGHDELRHMRSLDDVKAWFSQPLTGTVETAGAPWWRLLSRYAPAAKIAVIRRPVGEVVESLMRIDRLAFDRDLLTKNMWRMDRKLDQLAARVPNMMSIDYADLDSESTCARLFEHCTGAALAHDHWSRMARANIQVDMRALMRYAEAYKSPLGRLGDAAKRRMLADLATRKPTSYAGVTFQTESIHEWVRGARDLFTNHCVTVGEEPEQWRTKNWPAMCDLYERGAMQIMTARCNGRMFGYLMTVLSPSLVSGGMLSGLNATFFASPEFPGLGMKLQLASIQALKERGVDEIFFEAGKRGDGPRLGSMYRRLGAADHGQTFRLQLSEA